MKPAHEVDPIVAASRRASAIRNRFQCPVQGFRHADEDGIAASLVELHEELLAPPAQRRTAGWLYALVVSKMANELGVSHATMVKIWSRAGVKPYRWRGLHMALMSRTSKPRLRALVCPEILRGTDANGREQSF